MSALAGAQTQYYNLDAGRPGRVEDAEVTARYSLGIDLAPLSVERLSGGTTRLRAEPKLTYGVLPFTDVELRLPIVRVAPPTGSGARPATGLAGVALGGLHAFNLETPSLPALAAGGEIAFPVGGALAAPHASFLGKVVATKTTSIGRFHFNGGGGSYSVRVLGSAGDSSCTNAAFASGRIPRLGQGCSGTPPIIVDTPCDVVPAGESSRGASFTRLCMPSLAAETTLTVPRAARSHGAHWFGGMGFDRAFPLASTVISMDLIGEQFRGLYAQSDWTAEIGFRHQVTPLLVVDAGVGRHFAGAIRSTSFTLGASYEIATPPLGLR